MAKEETISLREYARRRDVSEGAVRLAIKDKKIVKGVKYNDKGRPSILQSVADQEWALYHDPTRGQPSQALADQFSGKVPLSPPGGSGPKRGPKPKNKGPEPEATVQSPPSLPAPIQTPEPEPEPEPEVQQTKPGERKSIAELKRLQAELRVQRDAVELAKLKGKLVDKDKVYSTLFAFGQELRTSLLSLPDRVIDDILAAPSRNDAHLILTKELITALAALADFQNRDITK